MRRLFIIRKDLHLRPGKLAAMIGHCCEAYWTNAMKAGDVEDNEFDALPAADPYHPDQPALYRHPKIYEASKAAFARGEKTFRWKKEYGRHTVTVQF